MADGAGVDRALSDILRTRVGSSVGLARLSRPRVESGPAWAEGKVNIEVACIISSSYSTVFGCPIVVLCLPTQIEHCTWRQEHQGLSPA